MIRSIVSVFCLAGLISTALPLRADDAEVEKLAKGLKAKNPAERVKTAEALGKLGEKAIAAAKYLCEACADESKEVREAALGALEKVAPNLYKPVVAIVVDKIDNKRVEAYKELEKLGDAGKPAVALLYEHVGLTAAACKIKATKTAYTFSMNRNVLNACLDALIKLAPDEKTVAVIASITNLDYSEYNGGAMELNISALRVLPKLAESSESCRKPMVPALIKALDTPACPKGSRIDSTIRAIETLAICGPVAKDAIPALKKLKLDESEKVRKAATEALERIDK